MNKAKLKIRLVFIAGILLTLILPLALWLMFRDIFLTAYTAAGMIVMLILMALLYKTTDSFTADIVSELSQLIDSLNELEERDVFSENEDSVVSKLQTKVIKLIRMTKMKNKRSVQEKENIKSLVSDISHQLKTPISNLIMYSGFLESGSLTDTEEANYIAVIRQSAERLNFLSESMIKISRLESGIIRLDVRRQSLNETVLKAVKEIYPKAKRKNTEIVYSEPENLIINHDRNWTSEAVFNLLDNAVKYSETGGKIYLTIKTYGRFSAVEVRDENTPIPENERAEIFRRFYRGKASAGKDGIGIGLYLVREIARRQGGYVKLNTGKNGNSFIMVFSA